MTGKPKKKWSMISMLKHFGLELIGKHHSGIDDAKNLSKILVKILETG